MDDRQIIEVVRQEVKKYCSAGDESVEIVDVCIKDRQATSNIEGVVAWVVVMVSWVSESTKDARCDDMVYMVSLLDDGTLDIFGPGW